MLDSATGTPATAAPDTTAPAPTPATPETVEARVSSKDIDRIAEAVTPKTDAEKAEKDAADLHDLQKKAFRKASDKRPRDEAGKFGKPEAENAAAAAKALSADPANTNSTPKVETKDQKPNDAAKPAVAPPETTPAANVPKPPQTPSMS